MFTTAGKAWLVDKADSTLATLMDDVGWGTGAGTALVGDTTLFAEDSGGAPVYARIVAVLTQPAADTMQAVATITSNGTKTITNAGVFTNPTGATLVIKGDFTGIPTVLNDQIQFTFQLQIT